MPDYPDDLPHDINLSMFDGGALKPGFLHHFKSRIGNDGLSFYEREERKRQEANDLASKLDEALLLRDFESVTIPCVHIQECLDECTASIENKKIAKEKYQKTVESLLAPPEHAKPVSKTPVSSKGPNTLTSKSAATALSQSKQPTPIPKTNPSSKSTLPSLNMPRSKKPLQPTNPSTMRHNAAIATSRTTIGHSKGRATSAALRKTAFPSKTTTNPTQHHDANLAPDLYIERYGVPTIGSAQWIRCKQAGCFDEELESTQDEMEGRKTADKYFREEVEREFVLEL